MAAELDLVLEQLEEIRGMLRRIRRSLTLIGEQLQTTQNLAVSIGFRLGEIEQRLDRLEDKKPHRKPCKPHKATTY